MAVPVEEAIAALSTFSLEVIPHILTRSFPFNSIVIFGNFASTSFIDIISIVILVGKNCRMSKQRFKDQEFGFQLTPEQLTVQLVHFSRQVSILFLGSERDFGLC